MNVENEKRSNNRIVLYITINTINLKYYFGVHKENILKDDYLGCGIYANKPSSYLNGDTPLKKAVKKYGPKNFIRLNLFVLDTYKEALEIEKILIDKQFLSNNKNYNAALGGGIPPNMSKLVYQFDMRGNMIKKWDSITDIKNYYKTDISIHDIIIQKRSFKNFYFSHNNHILIKEYRMTKQKKVYQFDIYGNLVNSFDCALDASKLLNIKLSKINSAIFKKTKLLGTYFSHDNNFDLLFNESVFRKNVYRYNKDSLEYDTEFKSISDAAKGTNGAYTTSIKNAIRNRCQCGGFYWSYFKCKKYIDTPQYVEQTKNILQYDKYGNLIKRWENPKECKKEFPEAYKVCNGKAKTCYGYIFKWKDN